MANDRRLKLQTELEKLLETRNVYYQPPESLRIQYPAIIYSLKKIDMTHADNTLYLRNNCYEVIVIDKGPDNSVIDKILTLPHCYYDRHYNSDNLSHDVFTLYY